MINVRWMQEADLPAAAEIHHETFVRQQRSLEWLQCHHKAFPQCMGLVAEKEVDGEPTVVGFILWLQKSGFRAEAVLELSLLTVSPAYQGQGIGQTLITTSLEQVRGFLAEQGSTLKHVMVTTRADNAAQILYRKTLGAEIEATLSDFYSADEVIMIARHV
ncbi:GNAT family N-acetyltransferase [Photobacterium aphoticum]|uniref:GNAT family N-acetyltransferase n=1 Tax=Photobacterium aphoticum TaxID=754436 RepID=UPI000A762BC5|nr:N-acetyltransferase [Photobacterium aphoticum]GHA34515.1 hypothetical protein GCM10007086_05020 [Photobacterium aphoticum]